LAAGYGLRCPDCRTSAATPQNGSQLRRMGSAVQRLASWVQANTPGMSSVSEGAPGSRAEHSDDTNPLSNQYQWVSSTEGVRHETEFKREPLGDGYDRGSINADTDASNANSPHTSAAGVIKASHLDQDRVQSPLRCHKAPQRNRDSGIPAAFSSQVDGETLYH
jgi:hypothetical protein